MTTEKERNMETNKLVHHTLTAVNNLKHRFDSLVCSLLFCLPTLQQHR